MPLYYTTTLIDSDLPSDPLDNPTVIFAEFDISLTIDDGVVVEATKNSAVFTGLGWIGSELINNGNIFSLLDAVHFAGDQGSIVNNEGRSIIGLRTGIDFFGDEETVTNYGTISGFQLYGIRLNDDSGNVLIDNYGDIFGRSAGIYTYSENSGGTINNYGTIRGESFGIDIGTRGGNATTIFNAPGAVIESGSDRAINIDTDGRLNLDNRGTINGLIDCHEQDDVIVNRGDINGEVRFGRGNDQFTGIGSSTSGDVFGEDGDDTLIGGDLSDNLHGGPGIDTLKGGWAGIFLLGAQTATSLISILSRSRRRAPPTETSSPALNKASTRSTCRTLMPRRAAAIRRLSLSAPRSSTIRRVNCTTSMTPSTT